MPPATPSYLILKCIAAHTLTVAIVSAITFGMTSNQFENLIGLLLLSGFISGLGIGGVEAWLLRPLLQKRAGWWAFVMALVLPLGITGGGFLAIMLTLPFASSTSNALQSFTSAGGFGFGIGAIVGVAQWVFLRRVFRHAWIWIATVTAGRTIGWAMGMSLVSPLSPLYDGSLDRLVLIAGIGGAIGGTVYGSIAGICLKWFVVNCKRQDNAPQQKTEG